MFVSPDITFDKQKFPFGENMEKNTPNVSHKEFHGFWQSDGVMDDEWNGGQHLMDIARRSEGLSPLENVSKSRSSPANPRLQPLTGLSPTGL